MTLIEIAAACIVSAGGIGGLSIAIIHFTANQIAERLEKRYEQRLEKEKARYQTELSKKEHVSKARFDREFQIYQELSEKNITMVYSIGEAVIVSRGGYETEDDISQFIQKLCDHINDAELTNKRMAPFIAKPIFEKYKELEKQASEIFKLMKVWNQNRKSPAFPFILHGTIYKSQKEVQQAIEAKQKILSNLSDDILDDLRDYLNRLDVIEI